MKEIAIIKEGEVVLRESDKPTLHAGEVLLRIHYVGFCGSDLNTFLGKNPMVKYSIVPGHEIGAEIEAVGKGVPDTLRPGYSCTVNPYSNCGSCPSCRQDRPNACQFNQTLGVQRNGAMREYIVVPWEKVILAPGFKVRDLALVEPMSVGFHAVARGQVTEKDTVLVIGCGMIGLGAIAAAAARGAKVVAVDIDADKLQVAKLFGACEVLNSRNDDLHQCLVRVTDGGPDVIIEAVGSPQTYRTAIDEAAFSGRVVCIGYAKSEIAFETKYFVMKELDIRGSRNALPEDFQAAIHCLQENSGIAESVISGIYPPEQALEALQTWAADPGKVFRILIRF